MIKINVLGSCVSRVSLLDGETSEHGIAGEGLELEYFLDKQNIVCAMLPPAFSKEEVDNIQDICMHEKYAMRSLQQNLNKDTLRLLMNSSAEWLVVDFMDMHMAHAKYNGTLFATQALEFYRTSLGKELWDVEKVRLLEQPFEKWKVYVDEFWREITRKYGSDHIILNCFRCNQWYISTEGKVREIPERFHGPSHPLPELNGAMRRLEKYVIDKYHPWVIDLSNYFMGDENMWDNLQGAHFEKEFYRETFDAIYQIVFGKTEDLFFSKPRFFDLQRRGIQEDMQLPFDIDSGFESMEKFYKQRNPLWINLLDKLYMRIPGDERVREYQNKLADV